MGCLVINVLMLVLILVKKMGDSRLIIIVVLWMFVNYNNWYISSVLIIVGNVFDVLINGLNIVIMVLGINMLYLVCIKRFSG